MKAVVITRHGGPEVLEVHEVEPPPLPAGDSVRVKVRAAALNRADLLQRRGRYPAPAGDPQNIPGLEFAGEVDALGEEARSWSVGQRVFGITGGGAQAEYVVLPESHAAEVPANLDCPEAAAVPEVFITAHDALFTRAGLQRAEKVLVHAAGSGVGLAAIQLARAAGALVTGTSRSVDKLERAKGYGLNDGIVVASESINFDERVKQITGGRGVDVILDLVGAPYLNANLRSLAQKGRMVLVGTTAGARAELDFSTVMQKRATIVGTVLRARSKEEKATAVRLFAEQVVPLLASGEVKPVIDRVYQVGDVREAHERMESNENFGKIVLLM